MSDKFLLCCPCPRPFEQLQFLRGTANLYMDLMDPPQAMLGFMREMHGFYCDLLELWAKTDVDGLRIMDDWVAQSALLIKPELWRHYFGPLYRDYAQIAHSRGKKFFMHSDGHIFDIFPDLVEIGVDAVNSQLFCMDLGALARSVRGRITFWGEIDRQNVLPSRDPEAGRVAVREVARHLYDPERAFSPGSD